MVNSNKIRLYEEILLLALKDEEGTIASGTMYNYAVGGAVVAELLLTGRIAVDTSNKKKLVDVVDSGAIGDGLLDEWIVKMGSAKRRNNLQGWVGQVASTRDLKHRIACGLCSKGILKMDEDKVLFVFSRRVYPEINPEPEKRIIGRLYNAIFTETNDIDPKTVVLLSLAKGSNILPVIFDKNEVKQRKDRIEKIVNGDIAGKATKEAIDAMQAAVMVCCIMPMMMTTVVTS